MANDKQAGARYYAKNREMLRRKARERLAQWRRENPEKYRQQRRTWYGKNRELLNARARAWNKKNSHSLRGKRWVSRLKAEYKMTPEQYADMLTKQEGRCAVCRTAEPGGAMRSWHIDHDHGTGAIRGLLCNRCNMALGLFRDSVPALEAAIQYLVVHTAKKVVGIGIG